jgi:glycosyltransferase involved in cell wall biosynthesis
MQPKCKVTKYSSKEPSLGVVVPCHNNSFQLYGVLKSLVYQTSRPETIVVVDDNSNSYEETKLRSLCRRFGVEYLKLPAPKNELERLGRRSHARNVGTNHLDTDVVLYLDGDMLLPPRYAEEIRFYHRVLPEVYIRGQRFDIPTEYQARGIEACLDAVTTQQIPAAKSIGISRQMGMVC